MNDMPSIPENDEKMEMERSQSPQGPPFEHRMQLFNAITGAMRDAEGQLEQDGLSQDLITQVIANTLCHALAYMAIALDMDRQDLAEVFLRYCEDVEAAQNIRLDS